MIDLKTYLEYTRSSKLYSEHKKEIREYNKALVEKYPWLTVREWDPDTDTYYISPDECYNFTWLDDMPDGWRVAFGEQLCEELQEELERVNFVDQYHIVQVKEKYGGLRWYTGGIPRDSKLYDIADKYESISYNICIRCGKPATWETTGWIMPVCDDCKQEMLETDFYDESSFVPIGQEVK